jgi:hypothetical protein
MNGNLVGAKMLAYLRGEKDLFEEREGIAQTRKQLKRSALGYWLSNVQSRQVQRFWQVVSLLEENSRMSLTEMSRKLEVPVSTLFECMKEVEKFRFTIVLRNDERKLWIRNAVRRCEFAYEISDNVEKPKEVPLSVHANQRG